jgi:putative tryptophan/tyrosine transport system substrate-binding protein
MGALDKLSAPREGLGEMTNWTGAQPLRQRNHRMTRRELMFLLGSAITGPRPLRAQQKAMPVIGFLNVPEPGAIPRLVAAFERGLDDAGYTEGLNVRIEYRWAENHYDRLPALAADLVARKVDVIAAFTTPAALAAKNLTAAIPIVFATGSDPVEVGLVTNLARPSGNLTGFSGIPVELIPKRLELLSELVPQARVIGLLVNPNNPIAERMSGNAREAARAKGRQLLVVKVSTESEFSAAFATLAQASALVVSPDDLFGGSRREQLLALAARHAIPAIYPWRDWVEAGGLISYGTSLAAVYRQTGTYVGKILNGAKPADLPVQQPTTFELVVNLKTAEALGLTVPQSILARADEVIE